MARLRCDVIDFACRPPSSNETIDVFYIKKIWTVKLLCDRPLHIYSHYCLCCDGPKKLFRFCTEYFNTVHAMATPTVQNCMLSAFRRLVVQVLWMHLSIWHRSYSYHLGIRIYTTNRRNNATWKFTVVRQFKLAMITGIHTYIHTYIHSYIHTQVHTYIHTHIRAYIHTYTHTHTHRHRTVSAAVAFGQVLKVTAWGTHQLCGRANMV